MTGKNETAHGGGGRGQGDHKKHTKHVVDKSKFPRLTRYFKAVQPKGESSSSGNDANDEPAGKRPRPRSTDIAPPSSMAFSKASEPPDIAPAASSYLLGKGGIISQAVSALKSGSVPYTSCYTSHLRVYALPFLRLGIPGNHLD